MKYQNKKYRPVGALTKLKTIWKGKNTALSSEIRLTHSFVISIVLYACETWTLTAELEKKIRAKEMRCFRRLVGISYRDHVTNEEVRNRIRQAIGPYEKTQEIVWTHNKINRNCKDDSIGHCTRREKERQTEKEMGRQHNGTNGFKVV